jgi:hypothetical protein
MIDNPLPRELTQGTIFTCAIAENYPDVPVLGIIITARCDLAHGKATILNYVPLIPFEDWLLQDGRRILAARSKSSTIGVMKNALSAFEFSPSVLHTLPHTAILAALKKEAGKGRQVEAKRFEEAIQTLKEVENALGSGFSVPNAKAFVSKNQKLYKQLAQELLSNSLADFYYVDRSERDELCNGYVALLREVRFIPELLVQELLKGIDYIHFKELCTISPNLVDKLGIRSDEHFAMPVGLMMSPYIEHFMRLF